MTNRILRSILIVAAVVLLASMFIVIGVLYGYFNGVQQDQLRDELELAAIAVEHGGVDYLEHLTLSSYRITWVDADGTVLFDNRVDPAQMENHADREEIREARTGGTGSSSRRSTTLTETTLYEARELSDGTVLRTSVSHATSLVLALGMVQPILIVAAIAIVLAMVLARGMARRIVQPLNDLDLDHPLDNNVYEELSPLLDRINHQHQQIADQLHELERRTDEFEQITGSMNEGLVLLDGKGRVVSINPAAKALFHADDKCVGQDFLMVERGSEIRHAIETAMETGRSELRAERGGHEYQFDMTRIQSEGEAVGLVLLAFDVSHQAYAERNRREFTANVSHELKTPLQAIIGSAELMENGLVRPEDMPVFVGRIRKEAARLVTLIEDVIRLSQLDEQRPLPHEDVDLRAIADDTAASLKSAAQRKDVRITVHGDATVVHGAPSLLGELVFNLCDNAVKYNVPGGSVDVTVATSGQEAVLTVKDSGIGIPEEHHQRIFERFYRVDKSHSKQSGGTGLGLSIVKHAVQYCRGRLELQSEVGVGTTITVYLPRG